MGKRGPKKGTGGRPKKSLVENIVDGNPGNREIKVLNDEIKQQEDELYRPPKTLNKIGKKIFNQTVHWLRGTKCLGFINPQYIEEYAICKSRWLECEEINEEQGLLSKHPTTGQPIQSPYVDISLKYLKQADVAWTKIWEIVKENSEVEYNKGGSPNDDAMAALFNAIGSG